MIEYYPEWLGNDIIARSFPWENTLQATLSDFLGQYSLHDSCWIGLHMKEQRNGLAIIRWDTFWARGKIVYPGPLVAEWPILILQLSNLQQVDIDLAETGISSASSRPVTVQEYKKRFSTAEVDLHYTQIVDHSGGKAHLFHAPDVKFLCLNRSQEILDIPFQ